MGSMELTGLSRTAKIMILSVIPVCLVLAVVGVIVISLFDLSEFETGAQFAFGVALGGIHSAVKIILIEKSLNRIADAEQPDKAKNMGRAAFAGRYLITIAVFAAGALVPFIGVFGMILSVLLSLRFAAYITVAVEKKFDKKEMTEGTEEAEETEEAEGTEGMEGMEGTEGTEGTEAVINKINEINEINEEKEEV